MSTVVVHTRATIPRGALLNTRRCGRVFAARNIIVVVFVTVTFVVTLVGFTIPLRVNTHSITFPELGTLDF